ncbi:MAG: tRNA pseudouridine(54/55) synthase Pus10 [Candidatus Aenigmatarchaeota archaeon]
MKIEETASKILKNWVLCDHCLGRLFAQILTGLSNEERGRVIRLFMAFLLDSGEKVDLNPSNFYGIKFRNIKLETKPEKCFICKNIFEKKEELAKKINEKLKGIEFETFVIGSKIPAEIEKAEEKVWEETGIEFVESIKSEINREIGKEVEKITKKRFEPRNPDVTILVDVEKGKVKVEIRSLYIFGGYKKLVRNIPQSKWICSRCKGKGCSYCKGKGKLYPTSVQEIIEKPLLKETKGKKCVFHGCVAPSTNVLLTHSLLPIKQLENNWKNQEILTYDIKKGKIIPSQISDFVKLNPKEINLKTFEITTKETGRKIISTSDHQFLTPKGMLPLKKIKVGEKLAVYPIEEHKFKEPKNKLILTEQNILDVIESYVPTSNRKKIIRELRERKLLPLDTKNKNLPIIARLLGFLFGDGTVRLSRKRDVGLEFYGNKKDLNEIRLDIKKIGYNSSFFKEKPRMSTIKDYHGNVKVIKTKKIAYKLLCYSKSLWCLLVALGAPIGNKVTKEFKIPEWVKNSETSIKREFLASLLGTEIDKPRLDKRKYNRKSFNTPRFSLNKSEKSLRNGLKFIEDLRKLLKEFEVESLKPRIIPYTSRKDGQKSFKICLDISNRFENLINLYGKIGFKYAKEKNILARYAYEYLLMKKRIVDVRKKIYKKALELKKNGFTLMEIFRKLGCEFVSYKNLALWCSLKNHKFNHIKVPNNFPSFYEWLKNSTKGLKGGLVWETVESIREVNVPSVYDLTTKKSTHTFFANGFVVSNSGREDIDARCLDFRPFIIEIESPLKRKIDLKKIEKEINKSKKVRVKGLKLATKEEIKILKAARLDKTYLAEVEFEKAIDKNKLKDLKVLKEQHILQKTPLRVLHRRADKYRKRKVKEISYKLLGRKKLLLRIKAEAGLYIKELITGDEGRTKPNVQEILGNKVKKIKLDVIKIHVKKLKVW